MWRNSLAPATCGKSEAGLFFVPSFVLQHLCTTDVRRKALLGKRCPGCLFLPTSSLFWVSKNQFEAESSTSRTSGRWKGNCKVFGARKSVNEPMRHCGSRTRLGRHG